MQRAVFLILFILSLFSLPALAKRMTGGFKVAKLHLLFPSRKEWDVAYDPALTPILSQPYFFLGKGAQSYVFESEDGHYVVKLFRYDQPPVEEKVVDLFNAAKLAYEEMREETGLLFVHLNVSEGILPVLHCKDNLGRSYEFPLDKTRFALQKKAKGWYETLQQSENLEKRINQFFSLLKKRTDRKIYNADPSLSRNFGFLEDQAIEFDFGNYRKRETLEPKTEIERFALKFRKWLEKNAPSELAYFDRKMGEL